MQNETPKPPNAEQLRSSIDRGAMGDKVAFPDPAAAPLGADAEAGGAAPTPAEAELALKTPPPPARRLHRDGALPLVLGVLALIAASAVLTGLIFAR